MAGVPSFQFLMIAAVVLFAVAEETTTIVSPRGYEERQPHHHFKDYSAYHSHIDKLDLDIILASRRLVHNYVECLLDRRPCNSEGDELKRILPDALTTKCAKCSVRQREGANKVMKTLERSYPAEWRLLLEKWDLNQLRNVL